MRRPTQTRLLTGLPFGKLRVAMAAMGVAAIASAQPTAAPPQATAASPQPAASPPQATASPPQPAASPPQPAASPPQGADWARACADPGHPPASLLLDYAVQAQRSGLQLSGGSTLRLTVTGDRYQLLGDTRAAGGLYHAQSRSEGTLSAGVLRPTTYAEKRGSRAEQVTTLDWTTARVSFEGAAAGEAESTTAANMQDRLSLLLQLGWLWRQQPQATTLKLPVAGLRRASVYEFTARGRESVTVAGTDIDTLKVERTDGSDDHIEVWLASSHCWLPARVRYRDREGNVIDQQLRTLTPPAAPAPAAR